MKLNSSVSQEVVHKNLQNKTKQKSNGQLHQYSQQEILLLPSDQSYTTLNNSEKINNSSFNRDDRQSVSHPVYSSADTYNKSTIHNKNVVSNSSNKLFGDLRTCDFSEMCLKQEFNYGIPGYDKVIQYKRNKHLKKIKAAAAATDNDNTNSRHKSNNNNNNNDNNYDDDDDDDSIDSDKNSKTKSTNNDVTNSISNDFSNHNNINNVFIENTCLFNRNNVPEHSISNMTRNNINGNNNKQDNCKIHKSISKTSILNADESNGTTTKDSISTVVQHNTNCNENTITKYNSNQSNIKSHTNNIKYDRVIGTDCVYQDNAEITLHQDSRYSHIIGRHLRSFEIPEGSCYFYISHS
jgi:hypothetical protein